MTRSPSTALAIALALAAAPAAQADESQPRAVPGGVVTDYHGVKVADPYRALEDVGAPATQAWATAENAYTRAQLDRLPGLAELQRRVAVLDADRAVIVSDVQITAQGRWFYLKRVPGDSVIRLVTRERADAPERVLLDPELWQKQTGVAHAINNYTASPDGKHVAAVVSKADAELGDLRVFDVASGQDELPAVRYVWGELPARWAADSASLLYSQSQSAHEAATRPAPAASGAEPAAPEPFGHMQTYARSLAGGADRTITGAGQSFGPPIGARDWVLPDTGSTRHVVTALVEGVANDSRIFVAEAAQVARDPEHATWKQIVGLDAKVREDTVSGHWLYVRTTKDAPRYRVMRYDLDKPAAPPVTVVAQQRGVIESIQGAADGLYYVVRTGSTAALWHLPAGAAKAEPVRMPFAGALTVLQGSPQVPGVVVALEGWTHEPQILAVRGARATSTGVVPPHDSHLGADWESEEVSCTSHDGVKVPMSLVHLRGLKKDGSHPVLLDGYGGYGEAVTAFFAPRLGALLERGGIYAEVDPRGGGAFGYEWYQAGVGAKKSNTWKDMIACAQALVDGKYTSPGKLAIQGTSMGGVAVGRSVTERPELFAAGIVRVGITDAIRFIEATTNGPNHEDEMGSLATEAGVKQLLAMSTYHQVKDGTKYPALLFTAGMNDNRVAPWITFKTFSRMQAATASGRPVLLRVEAAGGHGISETAAQRNAEFADRLGFLFWQTGDPDFQPVATK